MADDYFSVYVAAMGSSDGLRSTRVPLFHALSVACSTFGAPQARSKASPLDLRRPHQPKGCIPIPRVSCADSSQRDAYDQLTASPVSAPLRLTMAMPPAWMMAAQGRPARRSLAPSTLAVLKVE